MENRPSSPGQASGGSVSLTMTAHLTTFLALSLPGWLAAALLLFNAFLALKLAAAARRVARHERLFRELDHWASDVYDCLDRLALRQAAVAAEVKAGGGKLIPLRRKA